MQRERLEGWMVRQVENADLAKETVLQLPTTRTSAAATPPLPTSPRQPFGSPRRRTTTPSASTAVEPDAASSTQSPRQQHATLSNNNSAATSRSANAATRGNRGDATHANTSLEKQWRAHVYDATAHDCVEHDGHVDRMQTLRWSSQSKSNNGGHSRNSDHFAGRSVCAAVELDDSFDNSGSAASPLMLWGLPREHIVEYIRQSVLPSSWSMATKFSGGEWEAASSAESSKRSDSKDHHDSLAKALASLPPLALHHKQRQPKESGATIATARSSTSPLKCTPTSPRRSQPLAQTARSPQKRPQTSPFATSTSGGTAMPVAPLSPRMRSPRSDDRITRVLDELRADPSRWEAFAQNVKQHQEEQRLKIRENRERAASPRSATTLDERKRHADERIERTRQQRAQLVAHEERCFAARRAQYEQRVATSVGDNDSSTRRVRPPEELARTDGYRRRKLWLTAVAFVSVTTTWHRKLEYTKRAMRVAKQLQTRAAALIQRQWRLRTAQHLTSHHTAIIYQWLRKCMWKLRFKLRCRRRARFAIVIRRFLIEHGAGGSRETRNFNRMMVQWRNNVIHSQRISRDFVVCTRARLQVLSLWWDRVDHDRQRSERQQHERFVPTDEKEAEWTAMLHSRKLVKRQSSAQQHRAASMSIHGSSNIIPTPPGSASSQRARRSAAGFTASHNNNHATTSLLQLEHMNEKLASMQQVLTPFEVQRLQQNAYHVVRITKSIKVQLLREFLTTARVAYIQRLAQFHEQQLCASFTREVRLDDARAIVQNSLSWGSLLDGRRTGTPNTSTGSNGNRTTAAAAATRLHPPIVDLFALASRKMEELVKRGVQLTLERDAEQRQVVERQQQQRQSIDATTSIGSGLGSFSKKRDESLSTASSSSATSNSANHEPPALRKRQSSRRLAFILPFKDAVPLLTTQQQSTLPVLEDVGDQEL